MLVASWMSVGRPFHRVGVALTKEQPPGVACVFLICHCYKDFLDAERLYLAVTVLNVLSSVRYTGYTILIHIASFYRGTCVQHTLNFNNYYSLRPSIRYMNSQVMIPSGFCLKFDKQKILYCN